MGCVETSQMLCEVDVEAIVHLPISSSALDTWIWHYEQHGKCTIKSGYKMFMIRRQEASISTLHVGSIWWKKLWKLQIPNKIKHFIWRSFHNCILTSVNLWRHHVDTDGICLL